MLVSWKWLQDYIDIDENVADYCDGMIMSGSNLETCSSFQPEMDGIVIGKLLKLEHHPNADKLMVCTVDAGMDESLQVVTGAPNIYEGAYVPVALDGARLSGAIHGKEKLEGDTIIKSGELRGVMSQGMLCSATELGFGEKVAPMASKDGIWILPEEQVKDKVGQPFLKAMDMEDYTIDFEITPNRPDCLSMLGMARETKATFSGELRLPSIDESEGIGKVSEYISVSVKSNNCKRYTTRIIENVKLGQSPWWMQQRLMAAGMRPINNIVDITNFVMLEYGQPLHAFDIRNIGGRKIVVEQAQDGETFCTLDGKTRQLTQDMLMIKDENKSIAIAGIMGGMNSEVEDDTETIVLESANFVRNSVRTTSKTLGLRTEASSRYEKGIDPNLCDVAAHRFCQLVKELGVGTPVDGIIDIYPSKEESQPVEVRPERVNKILGTEIQASSMISMLDSLGCKVEVKEDSDRKRITVYPPTVRQDLKKEVDFIEEIARLYGYDKLPTEIPKGNAIAKKSPSWLLREIARNTLCALGVNEIQTMSFVSPTQIDKLNIEEDSIERAFVKILNPLGEDTSVMRTILLPSMLDVLSTNYARRVENVRAFEIGTTFIRNFVKEEDLPYEDFSLSLGFYGEEESFFTLKSVVLATLSEMGIKGVNFVAESDYPPFHPGRCARLVYNARNGEAVELGIIGEVHPDVCDNFNLETRVYCGEIMLGPCEEFADRSIKYRKPPRFPRTSRDIALTVDEEVKVGDIMAVMSQEDSEIFKGARLFDIYRGEQVGDQKKSLAFKLTYGHDEKTLTDEEVNEVHLRILRRLADKCNATLREQ